MKSGLVFCMFHVFLIQETMFSETQIAVAATHLFVAAASIYLT